ncbi:MAG: hypothetical protein J6O41_08535 [Clostridia bacterium]|nr:hypothetical protein [Clostridia bacterium]
MNLVKKHEKNLKEISISGITLIALVIMIVILLIISGVTIKVGKDIIDEAKYEAVKTNMLLIEAKAKEVVENASFKLGPDFDGADVSKLENVRQEVYINEERLKTIDQAENQGIDTSMIPDVEEGSFYWVTPETLQKWGLEKIKLKKNEGYFIYLNEMSVDVMVYNSLGFKGAYSLKEIEAFDNNGSEKESSSEMFTPGESGGATE